VDELNDLPKQVAALPVGKRARITVFRDGKEHQLEVTIARLSDEEGVDEGRGVIEGKLGLGLTDLSQELRRHYGFENNRGALVETIIPGGPAAVAGLQIGDLIIEANSQVVEDVAGLRRVVAELPSGAALRLLLQRGNRLLYTVIKVP
jgi:serine protease Do